MASGINTRMFNDAVEHVKGVRTSVDLSNFLNRVSDGVPDDDGESEAQYPEYMGKWCNLAGVESCLEFLDYYFTFCVEWAPAGKINTHNSSSFSVKSIYKYFYQSVM